MEEITCEVLKGKELCNIFRKIDPWGDVTEVEFRTTDGEIYVMYHKPDCCEHVRLYDVCGDLGNLLGSPILMAEEVTSHTEVAANQSDWTSFEDVSATWTFYKFATAHGYVTLRWLGESNGNYSEKVDFRKENGDGNSESQNNGI